MLNKTSVFAVLLTFALVFLPFANSFASSPAMDAGNCEDCVHVMTEQPCSQGDCMDESCPVTSSFMNVINVSGYVFSADYSKGFKPELLLSPYKSRLKERLIRPPIS